MKQDNRRSLTLVGSGIKFLSHLTTEAKSHIQQCDLVLYLVNEPAMKEWIQKNSLRAESLDPLYAKHRLRADCYRDISKHILTATRKGQHVCVVLYGHPSLFSQPGLHAARQAKREGITTKILPGISAEDCLVADLMIDTGECGCQSFEATDFLLNGRQFDPTSHLILWQVDVIGALDHGQHHQNQNGARLLAQHLMAHYGQDHTAIRYEAAQYPCFEPLIENIALAQLEQATFSPISTLYIPPLPNRHYDPLIADKLDLHIPDIKNNKENNYA